MCKSIDKRKIERESKELNEIWCKYQKKIILCFMIDDRTDYCQKKKKKKTFTELRFNF